jgi:hypothetical protein
MKERYDYLNEYQKKHYDRLIIVTKKGNKDKYKKYAEEKGMSLSGVVVGLLEQAIEGTGTIK